MQRSMPISISHDLVSNGWDTSPIPGLDTLRTIRVEFPRIHNTCSEGH